MNQWNIVHDSDDDEGKPTCWCKEINNPKYGRFVWISKTETGYDVEISQRNFVVLKKDCKSLASAKRWVAINVITY